MQFAIPANSTLLTVEFKCDVLTLGPNVFLNCLGLTITFNCLGLTITFNCDILTIGNKAFIECPLLTTLNINATTVTIGNATFTFTPLTTLNFNSDSKIYT